MVIKRLVLIQNVWRITDNPLLEVEPKSTNHVCGVINRRWSQLTNGFRTRSKQFEHFALNTAIEFCRTLEKQHQINCRLYHSTSFQLIQALLKKNPEISHLRMEEPIAYEELVLVNRIRSAFPQLTLETVWVNSLYDFDELALDESAYFKSFTSWLNKVEKKRPPITPKKPNLNPQYFSNLLSPEALSEIDTTKLPESSNTDFQAGERAGLKRLHYYLFESDLIQTYKNTRNQLLGFDYSSKFSPWLAHGALSPKQIWHTISQYEKSLITNQSTYWLKFELLWREFFRHAMHLDKRAFFLLDGLAKHSTNLSAGGNQFLHWANAKTDNDFVNAIMIELNLTGYLSNRARQISASYLIHDLKQDWRLGAALFESLLIDYDVASNWCNWAYITGVGHSTRVRAFNVDKQQVLYDPNLEYTNYWNSKKN